MKTSWDELILIERYLDDQLSTDERETFEDRLRTDKIFKINVLAQFKVRRVVKKHYLAKLRQQARLLHNRLYNDPARRHLRQAIEALFKS
jgi:hypothetical protein